jgi:hypothetical protein
MPLGNGSGLLPTLFCGLLGDFLPLGWRQRIGARSSTLQSALASQGDGGGVFVWIGDDIRRAVLDLAGENVAYQLAKLYWVAWAGKAFVCHASEYGTRWATFEGRVRADRFSNWTTTGLSVCLPCGKTER